MRARCLVVLSVLSSLLVFSTYADIPQIINYQGRVTESGGVPVANGDYSMIFTIYNTETSGTSLWSSGTITVTVTGGVFSVLLGDTGQPTLSLDFDIDYWLEIDIAGDIQSPRMPLGSVGYAYMASGIVPGTEVAGTTSTPMLTATNGGSGAGLRGSSDSGIGVRGETAATDSKGVYGLALATAGTSSGVHGVSQSIGGIGVLGEATATTGITYGIKATHESTSGAAVIGLANGITGEASGVIGYSFSSTGRGVTGRTFSANGVNYGVYGFCGSTEGMGVYGIGNTTAGANYGVYGISNSTQGTGVYGVGSAPTGNNIGVWGETNSPDGSGVIGKTNSTTGGIGIYGQCSSTDGFAGYFEGYGYFSENVGMGTTSPDRSLSVVGYVRAANAADEAEYVEIYHGGGNGLINWNGDGNLDIRYANSAKVTVEQDGDVGIGTTIPGAKLDVRGSAVFNDDGGDYDFRVEGDTRTNLLFANAGTDRVGIGTAGPNATLDVRGDAVFNESGGDYDFRVEGDTEQNLVFADASTDRVGIGTNSPTRLLDVNGWAAATGPIGHRNGDGTMLAYFYETPHGGGSIEVRGANGNENFEASWWGLTGNEGFAGVADSNGVTQAGMYVDPSGNGGIYADTKSFRVANPNQPDTEIWYACIEGPEAAAYLRGTARLENGSASIAFPDHFQAVATAEGMTVQLTPRSSDSKGLATIRQSVEGIEVRELLGGTGTYEFDYTITTVRKGHEDYQVIRPINRMLMGTSQ